MAKLRQRSSCSAVILSGGLNSRMGGRNKAFLKVGGRTILSRLLEVLEGLFEEILLVTRQPKVYGDYPVRVVTDIFKDRASLTGVHAGLSYMKNDFAFMVPCDAPFLEPTLVSLMLEEIRPDIDVVVPVIEGYYQPLCAVYSKRCLGEIEKQMKEGNYRIFDFYDKIPLKTMDINKLKTADNGLFSFFNVNTPEALRDSSQMARDS